MNGENKLTKNLHGIPIIKKSVENILSSPVDKLIVVLGYEKDSIQKIIDKNHKIKFVLNKNFDSGIASSIKEGINNLHKDTEAFFISLGDMPLVNSYIYEKLIKSRNQKEILIPTYKNQQGNPVLFEKSMKDKILSIEGDFGAKKIIESNSDKVLNIEINDESITKDFNTQQSFMDV